MTPPRHDTPLVEGDDDAAEFRRRLDELRAAARRAEAAPTPEHVIEAAVDASVRAVFRPLRRTVRVVGFVVAVVVAFCVVTSLVSYRESQIANRQATSLIAGEQASGEVSSARASSLVTMRTEFARANVALTNAGLAPVPDPGPAASAYEMASATGEAYGALRALGELARRGTPIPGVRLPDPASGEFPGIRPR